MNQGKINFRDLPEDSNDCLLKTLNQRRKWQTTSSGARKYHDLALANDLKENLTQRLLKNLSNTKRNVSEVIEKNKMTEWLKKNTIMCENKSGSEFNSDSGVSLCTSTDESRHWSKSSPHTSVNSNDENKRKDRFIRSGQPRIKDVEESFDSGSSHPNIGGNDYTDFKEFHGLKSREDDKPSDSYEKIASSSGSNQVQRISSKISLTPSLSFTSRPNTPSQFSEESELPFINIDKMFDESEGLFNFDRFNTDNISDGNLTHSNTSLVELEREVNPTETTSTSDQTLAEDEFCVRFPKQYPGIATSLIHLTQLKNSNKKAVANFLKNLTSCSYTKSDAEKLPSNFRENDSEDLPSNVSSEENPLNTLSNESLKLNFPNSNRKREEKLRSLNKEARGYDVSTTKLKKPSTFEGLKAISNISQSGTESNTSVLSLTDSPSDTSCTRKQSKTEFKISYSAQGFVKKVYDETNQRSYKTFIKANAANFVNSDSYAEKQVNVESVREMNTQAALVYLSETLIESAQRAEMLLMQKMKEYNDLVCREPPEKKKQDFSCQIKTEDPRLNIGFETKFEEMKFKYEIELKEKSEKIIQLEIERKKLRQALKKSNSPIVKKYMETASGNAENEAEEQTPRSVKSEVSSMKGIPAHPDFVQALKIENNLLHTLLKEMKAELDQENATILSLAKKLEMSLGKQSINKSMQQTDVVRNLENKLEQQEKMLKQEAMEARAIAKYVILKYKKLIQEYKQKVKSHQDTVDKLTNAIK